MRSYSYVSLVTLCVYFVGYVADARRRFPGFFIQSLAATLLVLGAAGRILYLAWAQDWR